MTGQDFLTQAPLNQDQINQLLGYPCSFPEIQQLRRQELANYHLDGLYSAGDTIIDNLNILGLGYVGLVVLVIKNQRQFALKIRRTNSKKDNLQAEAKALKQVNELDIAPQLYQASNNQVNELDIAPQLYQASNNFILMEYVIGQPFLEWLKMAIADHNRQPIYTVLDSLLEQAFQLDQIGLDRDDMKCITKDVIVTSEMCPVLLDFSGASGDRRPQNVTALVQGLFWGSVVANYLKPIFPHCTQDIFLPYLRRYKAKPNRGNFTALKKAISLSSSNL